MVLGACGYVSEHCKSKVNYGGSKWMRIEKNMKNYVQHSVHFLEMLWRITRFPKWRNAFVQASRPNSMSCTVCTCWLTYSDVYVSSRNRSVQTDFSVWLKSLFSFGSVDLKPVKLFSWWHCHERQTCSVWNSMFLFVNAGATTKVCWSHILSFHFGGKVL